jgi:hypothetical protein
MADKKSLEPSYPQAEKSTSGIEYSYSKDNNGTETSFKMSTGTVVAIAGATAVTAVCVSKVLGNKKE